LREQGVADPLILDPRLQSGEAMSQDNKEEQEEVAQVDSPDAEVLEEEPRNLLLALVSQIRPGMDLSKITLPTFILEPRSMLEKLTDFMTHGELLSLYVYFKSCITFIFLNLMQCAQNQRPCR
jgi:hypothetical protein